MKNPYLSIRAVKKDYEGIPLLSGIDFDLHEKETLCLLGPSGSGKSTLLRIIAGLESADAGSILWRGKDISNLPVEKRNFGLMFQDYALFPHMSVAENIAFGPRMRAWKKEIIQERVAQTLQIVKMEKFADRRVVDLSGGEKQRVALARTIAPNPDLLMLDQPLGALDKALRDELGQELHEILNDLQVPTIYVTHDQEEAFTVGDSVAVLNFGRILQMGAPEEIYTAPASLWIAGFLGFSNQVPGRVTGLDPLLVSTSLGEFSLPEKTRGKLKKNDDLILVIKPEKIQPVKEAKSWNVISGVVKDSQFRGDGYRLTLHMENDANFLFCDTMRRELGQKITLKIPQSSLLPYPVHE
jgi:ABC-type Fe3+/spermidine/putrescine transport system ATPase subunit